MFSDLSPIIIIILVPLIIPFVDLILYGIYLWREKEHRRRLNELSAKEE